MLAVGFSYMSFIILRNTPCIPTLLSVFIINGCCTLSNAYSAFIDMIMWFLSFVYVIFYVYWFAYIVAGMNPTWLWCMIFLMYCWMWFANILLRILASTFISDIGLKFPFFVISILVFGLRRCWLRKTSLGAFHLLEFFEIICGGWGLALP